VNVTGAQAHPFYRWALSSFGDAAVPRWNFHKILIGRDGRVIGAFESGVTPESPQLTGAIERALAARR
jgi:glutathione peroxidase